MRAFSRGAAWLIVRLRWPILLAWVLATIAGIVYLPSLQDAGDETSLIGLVPENAEAIETGLRSAELFDVPVITHTQVVQRNAERPLAGGCPPRRAPREADRGRARPGAPRDPLRAPAPQRPRPGPGLARERHDGDHLSLLRPLGDRPRRPGGADRALRREVRALRGRQPGRHHGRGSGADRGVAADRERLALGHVRDGRADRARARDPLPLAGRAARDAARRRRRLSRGDAVGRVHRRVARRLDPTGSGADPDRAAARGRDRLRGLLPARAARASRRRRVPPRGGRVGDGRVPADRRHRGVDRRRGHGLADGRRARVLPRVRPRDGDDRADLARGRDHARPGVDGDPRPAALLAVPPRPRAGAERPEPARVLLDRATRGVRDRRRRARRARVRLPRPARDEPRADPDPGPAVRLRAAPRPGRGRAGVRAGDPLPHRRAARGRRRAARPAGARAAPALARRRAGRCGLDRPRDACGTRDPRPGPRRRSRRRALPARPRPRPGGRPRDRLGGSAARPPAGARRGSRPRGRTGTAGGRHRARRRRPSRRSSATSSGSGSPRSSSTSSCWRSSCGRSWRRSTSCSRPAWRLRRASA